MQDERMKQFTENWKETEKLKEELKYEKTKSKVIAWVAVIVIAVLVVLYYQEYNLRMKLLDEYNTVQAEYEELSTDR